MPGSGGTTSTEKRGAAMQGLSVGGAPLCPWRTSCLVDVLTVPEAARLVGVREVTVRRACQRGSLTGEETRLAEGGTWLLTRDAVATRFGQRHRGQDEGVSLAAVARRYHTTVAGVRERRAEFAAGELWREGRRWMVTRDAAERVLGTRGTSDDT